METQYYTVVEKQDFFEIIENKYGELAIFIDARSLLQVKIDMLDDADQVFSTLMGDVVEPRKDFIQENALNVVNLDI